MENKSKSYKKKLIAALSALAVIGTAGVGTTLAYLTDSEQHTNTFTVGDVKIELEEPAYAALSKAAKTNIVPNEELPKNPFIKNTGVNDAIVFMKLTVPVENVTMVADDGSHPATPSKQEIFYFKDSSDADNYHGNHFDLNNASSDNTATATNKLSNESTGRWIELTDKELGTDMAGTSRTYVFGFSQPLKGYADSEAQAIWGNGTKAQGQTDYGQDGRGTNFGTGDNLAVLPAVAPTTMEDTDHSTINTTGGRTAGLVDGNLEGTATARSVAEVWNTSSLFEKIQLKNVIEDELLQGALRKIKIEAFAIQANDIILNDSADHNSFPATKNISKAQLTEIYEIFMNQGTKATQSGTSKDNGNSFDADALVKEADTGNKEGLNGGDKGSYGTSGNYTPADPGRDVDVTNRESSTESRD